MPFLMHPFFLVSYFQHSDFLSLKRPCQVPQCLSALQTDQGTEAHAPSTTQALKPTPPESFALWSPQQPSTCIYHQDRAHLTKRQAASLAAVRAHACFCAGFSTDKHTDFELLTLPSLTLHNPAVPLSSLAP